LQDLRSIIHNDYNQSISKTLINLFPEIGLDSGKFWNMWNDIEERRKCLEKYAKENDFDPLIPENWYLQSREKIRLFPGMRGIVGYHGESVIQTIIDLFPNIHLDKSKFNRRIDKPSRYGKGNIIALQLQT